MSEVERAEIHSYKYGSNVINFRLRYSERKSLGISVSPSCNIEVVAPFNTAFEKVITVVEDRANWIVKQLDYFNSFELDNDSKEYKSGYAVKFLGQDYMLSVVQVETYEEEQIEVSGDSLVVTIHDRKSQERINLFVEEWLRSKALLIISKCIEENFQKLKRYGVSRPQFYLRKMKRRWGSCTPEKVLFFNPEIISLPQPVISYVVMHELCHIKYQDHSKEFYSLIETVMPDWDCFDQYIKYSI